VYNVDVDVEVDGDRGVAVSELCNRADGRHLSVAPGKGGSKNGGKDLRFPIDDAAVAA
jgi:hypothetical protein